MKPYICIHGHFYQPPRENPWLEEVELQDSAYPYHDWNERITAECYAPNAASRILDESRLAVDIVNNYTRMSFNFGPTLLSWMERHAPEVHQAVVWADGESRRHFSGHGSALAQVYNHMIMPLANKRDKHTQVIWSIKDFCYRFKREPEGMWLSETAVDLETLDVLAELGIKFTILAPNQARRTRRLDSKKWRDVTGARVDPKIPYLCKLPSGKTISIFFYDGPVSQDIAFGGLLRNGEEFAKRLLGAFVEDHGGAQLVNVATDGETYGHHRRFGDMALAYCIHHIQSNNAGIITIYGEHLERFPPVHEVEIAEDTSWSCIHGVERWRSNCGCNSGKQGWTQEWRATLRESLNWIRDAIAPAYERQMFRYVRDPWKARDDYIDVILDRSVENVESFFSRHLTRRLSAEDAVQVLRLLEMQRHAMLMFTSCGWFFDEISGTETTQALRYAARAIQLFEKTGGARLEPDFLELLQKARSNVPEHENGAQVYQKFVKPAKVDLLRVGAHYAVSSLFEEYQAVTPIYSYTAQKEAYDRKDAGIQRLATGKAHLRSNVTWDENTLSFAVLHLGDHNLMGGVREFTEDDAFNRMHREVHDAFARSDIPETIRLIDKHFNTHSYSLWHLFRDEQRKVFNRILESRMTELEATFKRIYQHNYPIMLVMGDLQIPLPKAFAISAELTINAELRRSLEGEEPDLHQLKNLVEEISRWSLGGDTTALGLLASQKINALMEKLSKNPEDLPLLKMIEAMLGILNASPLEIDLMKAQHLHFLTGRQHYSAMREAAEEGDQVARDWVEHFNRLGTYLKVRTA